MFLTIYSPHEVTCLILKSHSSVTTTEVATPAPVVMSSRSKDVGDFHFPGKLIRGLCV